MGGNRSVSTASTLASATPFYPSWVGYSTRRASNTRKPPVELEVAYTGIGMHNHCMGCALKTKKDPQFWNYILDLGLGMVATYYKWTQVEMGFLTCNRDLQLGFSYL